MPDANRNLVETLLGDLRKILAQLDEARLFHAGAHLSMAIHSLESSCENDFQTLPLPPSDPTSPNLAPIDREAGGHAG